MKAKKKPIVKVTPADLGVDLTPLLEMIKVSEPPKRVGGSKVGLFKILFLFLNVLTVFIQVGSVEELVGKLKEAGFTAVQ